MNSPKTRMVVLAAILTGAGGMPCVAQYTQRAGQARQSLQPSGAVSQPRYAAAPSVAQRRAVVPAQRRTGASTAAMAGVNSAGTLRGARPIASMGSMSGLQTGLTAFAADMGRLPTTAEGLAALVRKPAGARNWRGPYVSQGFGQLGPGANPFVDPWGNFYQYRSTTTGSYQRFEIRSAGPDGLLNTTDDLAISG